jgi:hypothetical protein
MRMEGPGKKAKKEQLRGTTGELIPEEVVKRA